MKNLKKFGLVVFAVLIMAGGFQVIFNGSLESASISMSKAKFNGVERLMGLLPLAFGGLIIYAVVTNKTKFDD